MTTSSKPVAIVTGGSQGIGEAITERLVQDGAAVCILDIDIERAEATAARLVDGGGTAIFRKADITDFAAVDRAIADTETTLGPIDLLVNNAGFTDAGDIETIALDSWHREIDVNLHGPYHCIRAVLPGMIDRRAGVIVNIASVNGMRYFGNPAYSAAKAGIINLTQSTASEFGKYGIRCNAVLPGSVRTNNTSWEIRIRKDPDVFNKLARWYPMGRVAEPEDIAKAVSFLASEDASYITGAMLPVDGGLMAGMNVMIDEFILESKD
ncbi:SDR family NAD(P)-dependent oxidoreductase [Aliiruegeria lutimaris]|uniref:NAD(P)-dependent dehydrogenase, short-chain alcohol dehydrogenase family n=1 Tax=Aliiruegeria lutimaris TaxID=571298 RepID=A0A1G9DAW1_9RHOB|nr:glucose 1-dehydrogenase [Aliiruegeria lutimaris]SDK60933.1 NAD(P)-dependent dehydrogenase, short-chain alcohol dehydrogenase family [Aliiruegeria lutimaris]